MRVWIPSLSCLLVLAGFLLPLWPLEIAGILLAGLSGRWLLAVLLGLLLDVLYGAPLGRWHALEMPFTLLALLAGGVQFLIAGQVRGAVTDTL